MDDQSNVEWHLAGKTDEIEEDMPKQLEIDDRLIGVYKVGGTFYAIDDVCTHEFACLSDGFQEGDTVECPLHQARFHIPTGKVMDPPASDDVRTYGVKVEGDVIFVGVPKA